jgi:hypothetical protein
MHLLMVMFISVLYTVEFQKCGLPHVHILLWLKGNTKDPHPSFIDSIICAEIPDRLSDPLGYNFVDEFMAHGPCGELNKKCPCMKDNKCSKKFPKPYKENTVVGEDGFIQYKRSKSSHCVERYGVKLDNSWVVPYNLALLKRFRAHINVEWCNKTHLIKYLFKYITKGPDCARAIIESSSANISSSNLLDNTDRNSSGVEPLNAQKNPEDIDGVREYIDCHYLSSHEVVHYRTPSVERLVVHLPLMNNIVYPENRPLVDIVEEPRSSQTTLTGWFAANKKFPSTQDLTYIEFPTKWVWDRKEKAWHSRKGSQKIGRAIYINPNCGELYYLCMLLTVVKGATSFENLRTTGSILHPTFKDACQALGLLGDDNEWREALKEASMWGSASQM